MTDSDISAAAVRAAMERIRWDLPGDRIEAESFAAIEREFEDELAGFSPGQRRIARRLIHTTADPAVAGLLAFSGAPVESGLAALRAGAPVFCDSNMIRSGLSVPKLSRLCPGFTRERILCHVADADVAARAAALGRTRAICAVEKAMPRLGGAVVLIGNAPLALARIAREILEKGLRPALVIGMPVGFVNVTESKELLMLCDVPYIVLRGRRGGSPLAVAALHAVLESAAELQAPAGNGAGA